MPPISSRVPDHSHRSLPRPTLSPRLSSRRAQKRRSIAQRQQAIIARARAALRGLPTASLYRIHALLEQALAGPEIDKTALAELERALDGDSI